MLQRGYGSSRFAVEIDGMMAGWLTSAEGGTASADVIVEKHGADIQYNHLAGIRHREIMLTCGAGMSRGFYDWINATFEQRPIRRHGAIVAADFNLRERSRLTWEDGWISEVGLPALDAASKEPAHLSVKIRPERARVETQPGNEWLGRHRVTQQPKRWRVSDFALRIDGLDDACRRVSRIEAITIKQKLVESPENGSREWDLEPASVELSRLAISLAESHAGAFFDWYQSSVIEGQDGPGCERNATLEYLAADVNTSLFKVDFRNVGIVDLVQDRLDVDRDAIRRVRVEMYFDRLTFDRAACAAMPRE